jgi:hypothetical protein
MNNDLGPQKAFIPLTVEKDQRFSQSLLWQLHSAFYQQSGVSAWSRGSVPHYITNTPCIAGAYARVVLNFLLGTPELDPTQPVYLLELGAGSGRFAYHFLQRFFKAVEDSNLANMRIVYLLTDMAETNVQYWRQHPRFQPYLQSGKLELACFDPLRQNEIHLECSGETLAAGMFANPLIVLGNYFFDSLPVDIFSIHNGLFCEERVNLTSRDPQYTATDPAIVPSLEISFRTRLTAPEYYPDPTYNRLLQAYLPALDGACFSFPVTGLTCLRSLLKLSDGRMLFLAADKGDYQLEDLHSLLAPEISLHGSSISLKVNFHALAGYIQQQGGQALFSRHREEGLVFAGFMAGAAPACVRETRRAFREAIEEGGPDDFFLLKKAFEPYYDSVTPEQLLALLQISGDDAQIFRGMYPRLLSLAGSADLHQQERLYIAACRVWKMFYPIGEPFDIQLALAKLFIALARYSEALDCLRSSREFYGQSAETDALIDQCRQYIWEEVDQV